MLRLFAITHMKILVASTFHRPRTEILSSAVILW
jgi:hypothetical protein